MEKVWNKDYAMPETDESMSRETLRFDLSGLYAELRGDELTIALPAFEVFGPMFSETWTEAAKRAGLTELDLDEIGEAAFKMVRTKQLARLLSERVL